MKIKDLEFTETKPSLDDVLYTTRTELGRITVLDRLTGWGECSTRDIETGYRDTDNKFWLASGDFDIRRYGDLSISEAIDKIKQNANTCVGV